jgi:hypothetical protein
MPHDNRDADGGRKNISDRPGLSQDALRHEKDAQHHKFEKNGQQTQARAQQDSVEVQHSEEQQPEIPKVGSPDALGG